MSLAIRAAKGDPGLSLKGIASGLTKVAKVAAPALRAIPGVGAVVAAGELIGAGLGALKKVTGAGATTGAGGTPPIYMPPPPEIPVAIPGGAPPGVKLAVERVGGTTISGGVGGIQTAGIGQTGAAIGKAVAKIAKSPLARGIVGGAGTIATGIALYDAAGNFLGTKKRHRRMNALNPRALSRANRRVNAFAAISTRTLRSLGYQVSRHRKPRVKIGKKRCR